MGRLHHQSNSNEVFHLVLIKPTHYDSAGYPIRWLRSYIPSNTLACMNSLAKDARERQVLGNGVDIRIHLIDETNMAVRTDKLIRMIARSGGHGLIGLVGVQSNQFPRAVDLARTFRAVGLPVCIGGFHVSGCMAMLPEMPPEMCEAQELGISFFLGEAEERGIDDVLRDAHAGTLKPIYDHRKTLPGMEGVPTPFLPVKLVDRVINSYSCFDLGRGCPFECSFCTIINVHGRKSRYRSVDDLERIIRENLAQGVSRFFLTDDNLARNRNWEAFLDRLIELREGEGHDIRFIAQVDTLCHRIPRFIEKASRAGVDTVFIGMENINPDNLMAAKKRQNRITEYRAMMQKWKEHNTLLYAGYILGFPFDTRESILRDIEVIKRELPIDILSFFFLTPLPGSEDHQRLHNEGAWMDPDLNKYDQNQRVSHHPRMSDEEWEDTYRDAWRTYYTPEHISTVLRRAYACDSRPSKTAYAAFWYRFFSHYHQIHPMEGGFWPLRTRRDRRSGMKIEPPWVFYPKYLADLVRHNYRLVEWVLRIERIKSAARKEVRSRGYTDLAMTPPTEEEFEELDLFGSTAGAAAVTKMRKRAEIIQAGKAAASA